MGGSRSSQCLAVELSLTMNDRLAELKAAHLIYPPFGLLPYQPHYRPCALA